MEKSLQMAVKSPETKSSQFYKVSWIGYHSDSNQCYDWWFSGEENELARAKKNLEAVCVEK